MPGVQIITCFVSAKILFYDCETVLSLVFLQIQLEKLCMMTHDVLLFSVMYTHNTGSSLELGAFLMPI